LKQKSADAAKAQAEREKEQDKKRHHDSVRKLEKAEQQRHQVEVFGKAKGLHRWH